MYVKHIYSYIDTLMEIELANLDSLLFRFYKYASCAVAMATDSRETHTNSVVELKSRCYSKWHDEDVTPTTVNKKSDGVEQFAMMSNDEC